MEFCYAAVLRNDIPLAQYCPHSGNFSAFFQHYTEKNELPLGCTKIKSENFFWGIQYEEEGLTFVCVLKQTENEELIDKALDDIKSRFIRMHGSDWHSARPFGLQTTFEPQLILVKESILSFAGVNISPPITQRTNNSNENMLNKSIISDESLEKFDPSEANENLVINLGSASFSTKRDPRITLIRVLIIILVLILIYLILVLVCGGFNLAPRCFK